MSYLVAKKKCWDVIKKYYPVFEGKQPRLEMMIRSYLKSDYVLLDIGCGRGKETAIEYKKEVQKSFGIDISEAIKFNSTIHYRLRANAYFLPFADHSFDMVVSQELIEHLENPAALINEVSRILKRGGVFVMSTPNLLNWKTMISFMTSHRFHQKMNKQLHGIIQTDVFPTYYRMNRLGKIDKTMKTNQMTRDKIVMWEDSPRTLTFNIFTTYADIFITTILRRYELLKTFRELIIVCYKKT